ncbi:MAG TPA: PIG-L family deacetylase [Chryseolinea sp.]|nr:PIG-L family deacetylase [Chryseolinea sp.]
MKSSKTIIPLLISVLSTLQGICQAPLRHPTGDIYQRLQKLNTLGSVLYIAAHPDDENTQMLTYFSNGLHLRTGYLSATRGGGGQNLIGPEIQEELGIIRTQELLAARRLDGAEQFFSRAIDFGYSKNPDETFRKWDKQMVLADFVWVIRNFRPDVLITRFNEEPGITHGQHTASATLAMEAFKLSGDSTAFPEQLKYVKPWQPSRIFWNTHPWFYKGVKDFNTKEFIRIDIGAYNPFLGKSYNEIAAESRSMHKSQGFGLAGTRGQTFEYLQQWGGDKSEGLFNNLNTTWSRLPDTKLISKYVRQAIHDFDAVHPSAIVPVLLQIRNEILKLNDPYWKKVKLSEINELLLAATGSYIEFSTKSESYTPGDSVTIQFEAVNRSLTPMELIGVSFSRWDNSHAINNRLVWNVPIHLSYKEVLSAQADISNPYWLEQDWKEGMYTLDDQLLIGLPQNKPEIVAEVTLKIHDQLVAFKVPVVHKASDRVKGEVYAPVVIRPDVMVNMDQKAVIFSEKTAKEIAMTLVAGQDSVSGKLTPKAPEGWTITPDFYDFEMTRKGEEQIFTFKLIPPLVPSVGILGATAVVKENNLSRGVHVIDYDHIPKQTWFPKAKTKVVQLDMEKKGKLVGYVMGAGDEVPYSLKQMGYEVDLLHKNDVEALKLARYDAVIVGVRAFNTIDWLAYKNQALFEYVKNGGVVIVQYNTPGTVTDQLAPYPLTLSGDRVTVEDAEVRLLAKDHPVLNYPNKITDADFEGWVQERGLYFPDKWSQEFETILSTNDPGDLPLNSGLLIARYGKGYYVYTGISFFRQLPAGVPGAFRLLANMISLGKVDSGKD